MKKTVKDKCAERKAKREAGKTRVRPKLYRYGMTQEEAYHNPIVRYKPANDGTRRGVPNGLPARFLRPASREQRKRDMEARRGTLTPYGSIFKL